LNENIVSGLEYAKTRDEAVPLYTNKKKADHYAVEFVKSMLLMKNPSEAKEFLKFRELSQQQINQKVSEFIRLSDHTSLLKCCQETIIKFREQTDRTIHSVRKVQLQMIKNSFDRLTFFNWVSFFVLYYLHYIH